MGFYLKSVSCEFFFGIVPCNAYFLYKVISPPGGAGEQSAGCFNVSGSPTLFACWVFVMAYDLGEKTLHYLHRYLPVVSCSSFDINGDQGASGAYVSFWLLGAQLEVRIYLYQ